MRGLRRLRDPLLLALWPPLLAALCAGIVASLLTLLFAESPLAVLRLLGLGTWGSAYGIGQVLFKATPLLCTGLAVAVALRGGMLNVGAEGQITVGAFTTGLCGALLPLGTPAPIAISLCLLCGAAGGALCGALPGWLKGRFGAHEVITTIMLNFVVRALMVGFGARWFLRETTHTARVIPAAALSRLSRYVPALYGSAANTALLLGVILCAGCWFLLRRTAPGFALRAVGQGREAARVAGIDVERAYLWIMALSGALAGLGGANFVLGYKGYYEDGFSGGVGFMGIAVAVLGQGQPHGVLFAALLFGTLSQGGLSINALVPRELIDVLTAVVIAAMAAMTPVVRRLLSRGDPA